MRYETRSVAKRNTQGRHYKPKSLWHAAQPLDPIHTTSHKIAKIARQLLKLG
jgi:hypothetical protein